MAKQKNQLLKCIQCWLGGLVKCLHWLVRIAVILVPGDNWHGGGGGGDGAAAAADAGSDAWRLTTRASKVILPYECVW